MDGNSFCDIELLTEDNYYAWKVQMKALLIRNDAWEHVNGVIPKPSTIQSDANSEPDLRDWIEIDIKAQSDLVLAMSFTELKKIKGCMTARDIWLKLESINEAKKPARKISLLKKLTLIRMQDGEDIREYLWEFFDIVNKLEEIDVQIDDEFLVIILLHSLTEPFDNFRCVIESADKLPKLDSLRIKIEDEFIVLMATNKLRVMYEYYNCEYNNHYNHQESECLPKKKSKKKKRKRKQPEELMCLF